MEGNLKVMECTILHLRVRWNSLSTASWRHLEEISWNVLIPEFFISNFFYTFPQLKNEVFWHYSYKVCCSRSSTASWRHLEEVLLLYKDLLFHANHFFGKTWKVTWKLWSAQFCILECAGTACQLLLEGIWRKYHEMS